MTLKVEYFNKDDLSEGLLLCFNKDDISEDSLLYFGDDEDYLPYHLAWDEANAIVSVIIAHREMMDAKERLGRVPELTPPGLDRPEDAH